MNLSLGYDPACYEPMNYNVWAETFGKYRWYHEDGTPRTQYPLDYEWRNIYEIATFSADLAFSYRYVYDPYIFTNEFLANVPINWMKYKTSMELFSGMLDGNTISPDLFNQGYTRKLEHTESSTGTGNVNENLGERTDTNTSENERTSDTKARSINYAQGVQAYDNLNNNNIGNYGNDYASGFNDSIGLGKETSKTKSNNTTGAQANTQNTSTIYNSNFAENEELRRINYYDNLAFLRERMDRLQLLKPFQFYFEYLFNNVTAKSGFWA